MPSANHLGDRCDMVQLPSALKGRTSGPICRTLCWLLANFVSYFGRGFFEQGGLSLGNNVRDGIQHDMGKLTGL